VSVPDRNESPAARQIWATAKTSKVPPSMPAPRKKSRYEVTSAPAEIMRVARRPTVSEKYPEGTSSRTTAA
jgi:hypothetical protein